MDQELWYLLLIYQHLSFCRISRLGDLLSILSFMRSRPGHYTTMMLSLGSCFGLPDMEVKGFRSPVYLLALIIVGLDEYSQDPSVKGLGEKK